MHIPSCETVELCLPDFETALKDALLPNDRYDARRWLYVPNQYTEYRYILGTRGKKPLICVGINPSTAAPDALDNTLKSVERIALYNGYDSFLMFNVYAQRATRPDDMEQACNLALHRENMKAFDYALSLSSDKPAVWAAWGGNHRKTRLSFNLRAGHDRGWRKEKCRVALRGAALKKGAPASSALPS